MDEVLVVVTGAAGVLGATAMAWRWRRLPLVAERPEPSSGTAAAVDGLRVVAGTLWAAVIAGVLVPGLGGRLVMRVMAATSSSQTQGLLTEANEVVGEITLGGTVGFLLFVGLLGGLVVVPLHPFVRHLLPGTAWRAGLVVGVVLLGIVGVGDPLSPDNRDFVVLQPRALAVALVIGLALLFGVTFAALAARLDAALPTLSRRPTSVAAHGVLLLLIGPPLAAAALLYVLWRAVGRARLAARFDTTTVRRVVSAVVGAVVAVAGARTVLASVEILAR